MTSTLLRRARSRPFAKVLGGLLLTVLVAASCDGGRQIDPRWIRPDNKPTPIEGATNGKLSEDLLFPLSSTCDAYHEAAADLNSLLKAAEEDGVILVASQCYRDYAGQVAARESWCNLGACHMAAVPGTSIHGWGKAVDLRTGSGGLWFGSREYRWLEEHAGEYGWNHPGWAEPNGSAPEPWHWEWVGDGGTLFADGKVPSPRIRTDSAPHVHEHELPPPPVADPAPQPATRAVSAQPPSAPAAPAPNATPPPAPVAPAPAPAPVQSAGVDHAPPSTTTPTDVRSSASPDPATTAPAPAQLPADR